MAYQFIHLESWSRKSDAAGRSTDFIFDEASRKPIASVHVPEPKPPAVVYGVGIDEVRRMHDLAATAAMTPGARGKPRKVASTQKTLHTVVASHPYTVEEVFADREKAAEVRDWERRTVAWLQEQYGPALKSVIRHTDEKQWHRGRNEVEDALALTERERWQAGCLGWDNAAGVVSDPFGRILVLYEALHAAVQDSCLLKRTVRSHRCGNRITRGKQ